MKQLLASPSLQLVTYPASVWLGKCLSRGMWALIALISGKVFQKGGSRGGAKRGEKQENQPELAQDFLR